jgi:voltage-gated potassium channel
VASAAAVAHIEKLPFGEALYFSFITGLTIGYGDIVVKTPFGRLIAVMLGLIGIVFSGLIVAAALHAVGDSMKSMKKS